MKETGNRWMRNMNKALEMSHTRTIDKQTHLYHHRNRKVDAKVFCEKNTRSSLYNREFLSSLLDVMFHLLSREFSRMPLKTATPIFH